MLKKVEIKDLDYNNSSTYALINVNFKAIK